MREARADDILERSSSYFQGLLWESEVGTRVRSRLSRSGIDEPILRAFRVGYAPGDTRRLLAHLAEWGYTPEELTAAGLASRSERSRLHVVFHGRIMFPIGNVDGGILGFAGLATHLGPSWPMWLTSPDQGPFDAGTAIFGIGQATPEIARARRALVLRDCVQVLALHQQGRRESVAVIGSPITRGHRSQLAAALGTDDLHFARQDGRLGVLAAPANTHTDDGVFPARTIPAGFTLIESTQRAQRRELVEPIASSELPEEPPPARRLVYLVGVVIGVLIPLGLLLVAAPHNDAARGSTPTLNLVIIGVVAAYLVLALAVARISASVRARSQARRMREPWARGSGEWQPIGWTYHRLEEILVGAALATAVTCIVLLMTMGGFLG